MRLFAVFIAGIRLLASLCLAEELSTEELLEIYQEVDQAVPTLYALPVVSSDPKVLKDGMLPSCEVVVGRDGAVKAIAPRSVKADSNWEELKSAMRRMIFKPAEIKDVPAVALQAFYGEHFFVVDGAYPEGTVLPVAEWLLNREDLKLIRSVANLSSAKRFLKLRFDIDSDGRIERVRGTDSAAKFLARDVFASNADHFKFSPLTIDGEAKQCRLTLYIRVGQSLRLTPIDSVEKDSLTLAAIPENFVSEEDREVSLYLTCGESGRLDAAVAGEGDANLTILIFQRLQKWARAQIPEDDDLSEQMNRYTFKLPAGSREIAIDPDSRVEINYRRPIPKRVPS